MTKSLREHLLSLNADVLKDWLRRVGALDKRLMRKDQFALAIEQQLTLHLPAVLAQLSDAERCLLAESAHQRRLITPREFTAKYGGDCPVPSASRGWKEAVSLLVPFIHRDGYRDAEPPHLIDSLVEPLRTLLPKPPRLEPRTVARLPKAWPSEQPCQGGDPIRPIRVFEGERIAPVELSRVLRLIQGAKVKVTEAAGRPTEATVRSVGEALVVPDFDLEMPADNSWSEWDRKHYTAAGPVRAHAWPVLVQQCGWARARGGALALTGEGQELLRGFTPEKFRAGVSRGMANGDFDELNRINHIRGQSGKARRWLSEPAGRRLGALATMNAFPVGAWLTFSEAQRVVEAGPDFGPVLRTDGPALYFFDPQFGFITDNLGLGRQFLRAFFLETLATLGLLDVGFVHPHRLWPDLRDSLNGELPFCGRYDGLLYVRVNPLGAYALGFRGDYQLPAEGKPKLFRVLPNHEVLLAGAALNPADRAVLELLAAPVGEKVWALNVERILAHVEAGGTLRELLDFLEANADGGLPGNVRAFLADLASRLGACLTRREAVLLEWADEPLARFLATCPETHKLCFHAGNSRLVVPTENLGTFSRALKRLGYLLPPAMGA